MIHAAATATRCGVPSNSAFSMPSAARSASPLAEWFNISHQHDRFSRRLRSVQYGVVIDSGSRGLRRKSLVRRIYGFRDCKVKIGATGDDDVRRLRIIRRWVGHEMDLRLDANEAWQR